MSVISTLGLTSPFIITVNASQGSGTTVSLPPASVLNAGTQYYIKKIDGTAGVVTIAADGTQLIDDASTFAVTEKNQTALIYSTGTGWIVLSKE